MKLTLKRSGGGAAGILEAAEDDFAPNDGVRQPAPAGALHRGYRPGSFAEDGNLTGSSPWSDKASPWADAEDADYVPRRGRSLWQQRLQRLPRTLAGRIVLGGVTLALLGAIAVGVAAARAYILHDPRFVVASTDDIQVTGNAHLTREQVLAVFGGDLERSIFRISLAERRADLERLPWVDHATVMRLLPNVVRVAILERTPVAFVRQGSQIGLVDAGGVLLDMPAADAGDPRYSFPVLTGIDATEPLSVRASRMELYRAFLKSLSPAAAEGLSEVDVSDPEDVKALIPTGSSDVLVHFGDTRFADRYADFEAHLGEWLKQYPKLASADMRYQGQVVLEMAQGAGAVTATAAGDGVVSSPIPLPAPPPAATALPAPIAEAAARPVAAKTIAAKTIAARPVAAKPVAASASLPPTATSPASAIVRPATPVPPKPVPLTQIPAKPLAPRPTLKTVSKPIVRRPPLNDRASGSSAANQRMFAALAAARKRQQAQAANKPAGGGR